MFKKLRERYEHKQCQKNFYRIKDYIYDEDHKFISLREVLNRWATESNASCIYIKNYKKRVVDIYTNKPGYFIGAYGKTKEKYFKYLKEMGWKAVLFHEIDGAAWPKKDKTVKEN